MDEDKRRPAIIIDGETIAILAMMVTSKEKDNCFSAKIDDWKAVGLPKPSWARIDKIIKIEEWRMLSKIGSLSENDFLKFMQLIADFTNVGAHEFSLVAIDNCVGKYLQVYDEEWGCWLFPYFRSTDSNKENVDRCVSDLLKKKSSTNYVTVAKHCKYSVRDMVYKNYNHKLYKISLKSIPEHMKEDAFEINGIRYAWKSFVELEDDEKTMQKNDDVIAFVKSKCV